MEDLIEGRRMTKMNTLKPIESAWQRFGSMINSALIIAAALGFIWKAGAYTQQMETSLAKNASEIERVEREGDERWTVHDNLHKEAKAAREATIARFDERIKFLEETKIRRDSQIEALQSKTIALDQSLVTLNGALRDLSNKLNDVVADSRVSREILQRLEASQRRVR